MRQYSLSHEFSWLVVVAPCGAGVWTSKSGAPLVRKVRSPERTGDSPRNLFGSSLPPLSPHPPKFLQRSHSPGRVRDSLLGSSLLAESEPMEIAGFPMR